MREDSCQYEYTLDNQFFADIDAPEIQRGKLKVVLNVKNLELPVNTDDTLKVKMGLSFSEEGDVLVVPEEDGYVNVAWFIYEFIELSLPMKHVHAPGKCNKAMMGTLNKHLCTSAEEESLDDADLEEEPEDESRETDPRWDDLKKILDNN